MAVVALGPGVSEPSLLLLYAQGSKNRTYSAPGWLQTDLQLMSSSLLTELVFKLQVSKRSLWSIKVLFRRTENREVLALVLVLADCMPSGGLGGSACSAVKQGQ